MARPKKIIETVETPVEKIENKVVKIQYMPIMMRDTKEVKNIDKSEYDSLIHICI